MTLNGKAVVLPKLTKRIVDSAELREKPYFIWCADLSGFGVRVFPSGRRVYYADYRADGVRRRMNIGAHGKVTTEDARKLAISTMGSVIKGEDPLLERQTRRHSLTIAELCDRYVEAAEKGLIFGKGGRSKKLSTLYTDKGRIERHIKPLLGSKRLIDFRQADVAKFIRDVSSGKTAVIEKTDKKRGKSIVRGGLGTASRTTGLLGGIFTYARSEGMIEFNPVHGVKKPADNRRMRRLSSEEYARLGSALDAAEAEHWQAIAGIKLLAFTGCRRSEIAQLKWSEVDFDGAALRLGDSKTGASVRPLPKPARELLELLDRENNTPWVLPGVRDPIKPYGGLPNAFERIAKAANIPDLTAHVLRHSFASVAGDLDYSEPTIAAILGHAGHTITSRYVHRTDSVLSAAVDKICEEIQSQMKANRRYGLSN